MAFIVSLIFGLVVGFMARAIMPGKQSMGLLMTLGLGVAGSMLGGAVVSLLYHRDLMSLHFAGLIGSVLGAVAILAVATAVSNKKGSR